MKPRLLVTRRIFPEVLDRLAPHFDLDANQDDAEWPREALLARAADCDALLVVASDRVDGELLERHAPVFRIRY